MSFDITWHPPWASIAYRKPYFLYNQPNIKPKLPFNRKHLKTIIGVKPINTAVVGRCAAANSKAERIFATTNIHVVGFSYFLRKNKCITNATKDIMKSLNITSSITPP